MPKPTNPIQINPNKAMAKMMKILFDCLPPLSMLMDSPLIIAYFTVITQYNNNNAIFHYGQVHGFQKLTVI